MTAEAHVIGAGARTSEGLTARQTVTSLRARPSTPATTLVVGDDVRVSVPLATRADLPRDLHGYERLLSLAAPALREAWAARSARPVPVIVALPRRLEGDVPPFDPAAWLSELSIRSGVPLDLDCSEVVELGRSGGMLAIERAARRALEPLGEDSPGVLVGGVDSYHDPMRLRPLVEAGRIARLHPAGAITPSEAAAFLHLHPTGHRSLARIRAVATRGFGGSSEAPPSARESPNPLAQTLEEVGAAEVHWFLTDVTGETGRIRAWNAALRQATRGAARAEQGAAAPREEALGATLGEVGAAFAPLLTVVAVVHFAMGAAPTERVVVAVGDDAGQGALSMASEASEPAPRPAPRRDPLRSPAHEIARASRRVAMRILAELRPLVAGGMRSVRTEALARLTRADASFRRLANSDLDAPDHVDLLADAIRRAAELGEVAERWRSSESGAHQRKAEELAAFARSAVGRLEKVKVDVVEQSVRVSARSEPVEPPRTNGSFARATRGRPGLYDYEWDDRAAPGEPLIEDDVFLPLEPTTDAVGAGDGEDEEEEVVEEVVEEATTSSRPAEAAQGPSGESRRCLARRAEEAFEALARLSQVRRVGGVIRWSPAIGRFEDRMLRELDVLYALEHPWISPPHSGGGPSCSIDVLSCLDDLVRRRSADPDICFVRSFLLCCSSAEEPLSWVLSSIQRGNKRWLDAHREALCLASNPGVTHIAEELCRHRDADRAALGLDVLIAQRSARVAAIVPLLFHPDAALRERAARALAGGEPRQAAIYALERQVDHDSDPVVGAAIIESLVRLRAPFALERVRVRVLEARADLRARYLALIAFAGRPSDLGRITGAAREPDEVELLGWYGMPEVAPRLCEILEERHRDRSDPASLSRSAARALQRITGAVPSSERRDRKQLTRGHLTVTDDHALCTDPKMWKAYLAARSTTSGAGRLRFGERYELSHSLRELRSAQVPHQDRAYAALEAELNAPEPYLSPDGRDWVQKQLDHIDEAFERRPKS